MNIKDNIEIQIKRNEDILNFLHEQNLADANADNLINIYFKKMEVWDFESSLTNNLAILLQLSNVEAKYNQYSLEDVRRLFLSSLNLQVYNLETYLELASFENSVMDDIEKAENILDEGIKKAKEKIDELSRLKESIQRAK